MKCPESIDELNEMERLIPLCKLEMYNQAKARIESGAAKSVSEAARQIAEETGKSKHTVRSAIQEAQRTDGSHQLSEMAGTDKHRPDIKIEDAERLILKEAKKIRGVIIEKKHAEIKEKLAVEVQSVELKPTLYFTDGFSFNPGQIDMLLTDPPYSTDIENINEFAPKVLDLLRYVKPTGRAYIFIGSYPNELTAYLTAKVPNHMTLSQILVWTYRNTLGPAPKLTYKNNWQAILYFIGKDAAPLNCPILNELFSVQDINAPDGRLGDRYHAWQKPLEIADRFIRHSTNPGDIVFDPFACTGTFLISAAKLGRIAIGCEIDPDSLEIAKSRGIEWNPL